MLTVALAKRSVLVARGKVPTRPFYLSQFATELAISA